MKPSSRALQQRHRWYARLLVICLTVLLCFSLPLGWGRISTLGYVVLPLMLSRGLCGSGLYRSGRQPSSRRWDQLFRLLGLACVGFGLFWALTPLSMRGSGIPVLILWTVFVSWSCLRLIEALSQEHSVNRDVLMGAAAGYLLIGLTGGLLFSVLETTAPGSFVSLREGTRPLIGGSFGSLSGWQTIWALDFVRLNYFAFVTLTSTGYGEIVPHTPQAQMACISLAVLGVLYVAIVMGLLISRLTVEQENLEQENLEQENLEQETLREDEGPD